MHSRAGCGLDMPLMRARGAKGPLASDGFHTGKTDEGQTADMTGQTTARGQAQPFALLLETFELVVRFGGVTALNGVTLKVPRGDLRAIIGPNGAGKTTLFNAITGAIRPTGGRILFEGRDISGLPPHVISRLGLSRSFQLTNVFPELTVLENVWLGFNARAKVPWHPFARAKEHAGISAEVDRLCTQVGLADKMDVTASSLSHGDQRLLEIAIALSLDPQLLLLDEPTQGVSPQEVEVINGVIREIGRSRGVMLIEHNMATVVKVAQVVTVLHYGQIIAEGTPTEVIEDPKVQEVYLGLERIPKAGR